MKKTFKHKLTSWLMTLGFASACGVMAVANAYSQKYEKTSAYTVQTTQQSVTFSILELNNCSYAYLYDYDMNAQYSGTRIQYGSDTYNYIGYNLNTVTQDYPNAYWYQTTTNQDNEYIIFMDNGRFNLYVVDEFLDNDEWQYSLTIYSEYFAENMQKYTTLSANQLNNNTYQYLANQYDELNVKPNLSNTYIIYNNNIYPFLEDDGEIIRYNIDDGNDNYREIIFNYSIAEEDNYCKWTYNQYYDDGETVIDDSFAFTNSITIYSTWIAENINAPFTDGDDIIGGITSGLGLISYIATAFLNGFTGLFYVNNQLTNFAIYSLVMLGVAITFSIIKLVMNILRSNTGA